MNLLDFHSNSIVLLDALEHPQYGSGPLELQITAAGTIRFHPIHSVHQEIDGLVDQSTFARPLVNGEARVVVVGRGPTSRRGRRSRPGDAVKAEKLTHRQRKATWFAYRNLM